MPRKPKLPKTRTNLKDLVAAAHAAGAEVRIKLEPKQMPRRFPDDPEVVRMLIDESERISQLGNNWMAADVPNHIAADLCFQNGWAYALAAIWLRCKLKGELKPESKAP